MTNPSAPNEVSAEGFSVLLQRTDISAIPKRRDFLSAARARKQAMPGLVLQARKRAESEYSDTPLRLGLTCSKKVGNAVARNHARRRLKEAAWQMLPTHGMPGWDYVLIGRKDITIARPFSELLNDVEAALKRIHTPRKPR